MLLNAILPIFLLIAIGYFLKIANVLDEKFWPSVEKLTYYFLFPALLIGKMSIADLTKIDIWPIVFVCVLSLLLITIISFAIKPLIKISDNSFGAVYQGVMRFNTYIGLALTISLFGEEGIVIAVIIASILIPAVNICSVIVLQYYYSKETSSSHKNVPQLLYGILKSLTKNPLILGCIIGIGINISHIHIPLFLAETIKIIGSMALPLGLMAAGAAFLLTNIQQATLVITSTSVLKLVIYPSIAFFISTLFQLDQLTQQIFIIFCALPTATASYVLTKSMNGDHQLMARIITIETLLSGLSLLVLLKLLNIG